MTATALVPVEAILRQYDTDIAVWLLGWSTANPDLVIAPNLCEVEVGDEGEELPITGWTVIHTPTRMPVVAVSFTLDDARIFANTIAHLDWAGFSRAATWQERLAHPYSAVVSAALKGVIWW